MKAYEYILTKQIQWALNQNFALIGSKGNRGRPSYTKKLKDNLFQPLLSKHDKSLNLAMVVKYLTVPAAQQK